MDSEVAYDVRVDREYVTLRLSGGRVLRLRYTSIRVYGESLYTRYSGILSKTVLSSIVLIILFVALTLTNIPWIIRVSATILSALALTLIIALIMAAALQKITIYKIKIIDANGTTHQYIIPKRIAEMIKGRRPEKQIKTTP